MLSERSSVDIHALKRQGFTISEIARRTNHDRKTIRAYLNGQREPGVRARAVPDPFDEFVDYVSARLTEDPHLWAVTLFDELRPLGFEGSYPSVQRWVKRWRERHRAESEGYARLAWAPGTAWPSTCR